MTLSFVIRFSQHHMCLLILLPLLVNLQLFLIDTESTFALCRYLNPHFNQKVFNMACYMSLLYFSIHRSIHEALQLNESPSLSRCHQDEFICSNFFLRKKRAPLLLTVNSSLPLRHLKQWTFPLSLSLCEL